MNFVKSFCAGRHRIWVETGAGENVIPSRQGRNKKFVRQ